jgi:hypothetical protein
VSSPIEMPAEVMAATIAGLQAELAAERAAAAVKVAALEDSLTDLAHENALLKRRLFGTRTERSVSERPGDRVGICTLMSAAA